ncbi:MAG: hypothetical protein Ct9H300mP25_03870 [Acidobacteriota bacterium]|nr:MAG: hypothetical protein Ct9H300mP25_03870 [Acidobacteriota bacterium]
MVPYGNDEYYRVRPNLGISESQVLKNEDGYGFHPALFGFERLYKDGNMAVVHGCGYDNPSLSHFSSMGYWHTGVPQRGETLGWGGRLADGAYDHDAKETASSISEPGNHWLYAADTTPHWFLMIQQHSAVKEPIVKKMQSEP